MNKKAKLIILTLLVYGIPIAVLSIIPFYKNLFGNFNSFIFNFLFFSKTSFSSLGIIFDFLLLHCIFLLFRKEVLVEKSRTYLIYLGLKNIFRFVFINGLKKHLSISNEEKNSLLFYCVKIVWAPVMINFLIENSGSLTSAFFNANSYKFTPENILGFYFHFIFYLMLSLDTAIFAFGYLFESAKLKNIVKSVEPTALGWAVALICYPPFNNLTANIIGWNSSDFSNFGNTNLNLIFTFLALLLFSIYVWASVALGFKASNLTNRGIVSNGPYKFVRHPAYFAKNLSWWIMGIPFIKAYGFVALFSLVAWSFIYFLRALTEERHLMKDENYITYMKKVKYMFVPGIF